LLTCCTGACSRGFTKAEFKDWIDARAKASRLPPAGIPRALRPLTPTLDPLGGSSLLKEEREVALFQVGRIQIETPGV